MKRPMQILRRHEKHWMKQKYKDVLLERSDNTQTLRRTRKEAQHVLRN